MLSGLRELDFVSSVITTDGSEVVIPFRLSVLVVAESYFSPGYLSSLIASSRPSLERLYLSSLRNDDSQSIASAPSLPFPRLERLTFVEPSAPCLGIIAGCPKLERLSFAMVPDDFPFSILHQHIASLSKSTLLRLWLDLGIITRKQVQELVDTPSLRNLESLQIRSRRAMRPCNVKIVEAIKGKEGKLTVEMMSF